MKINKFEKRLDSMINESFKKNTVPKRKVLKEGKYNKEILDVLGPVQSLIQKLKNDKSIDKKLTSKLHTQFSPIFNALHKLVDTNEIKEEYKSSDDTMMFYINTYPWYFQKMGDSTHFKMANNEKALKTGAAMAHHVGQHRGETYYNDLVKWLHGKVDSKKLNGKQYAGSN